MNQLRKATYLYEEKLKESAKYDHEYRLEFSKAIILERADKTPVSIISDICRGKTKVADARYKREIADGEAKAIFENIQRLKIEIRLLESDISNQYNRG